MHSNGSWRVLAWTRDSREGQGLTIRALNEFDPFDPWAQGPWLVVEIGFSAWCYCCKVSPCDHSLFPSPFPCLGCKFWSSSICMCLGTDIFFDAGISRARTLVITLDMSFWAQPLWALLVPAQLNVSLANRWGIVRTVINKLGISISSKLWFNKIRCTGTNSSLEPQSRHSTNHFSW